VEVYLDSLQGDERSSGALDEIPGKMRYEAPLYVRLHRTLYSMYGKTAGYAEFLP
jgi:hypothetical protein